MSAAVFFPMDLLMDLSMLICVQFAFSRPHPKRLLAAQTLLSLFTIASLKISVPMPIWAHMAILLISAAVATGLKRPVRILEAAVAMLCFGASAAGFLSLKGGLRVPCAIAGCLTLLFLLRRRRHEKYRWNVELYLEKDGQSAFFPALIDTGNRLREHESGLPVLIVEASAMPAVARYAEALDPAQTRALPFGVLGSSGEIRAFRPSRVCFALPNRGLKDAPACWVAVYSGKIPGGTRALAPPEFAQALSAAERFPPLPTLQNRSRRFFHGVFKR